ncbi:MAG TPA: hypothetical protein VF102_01340 [Gemmatimonadaceae bacterium]
MTRPDYLKLVPATPPTPPGEDFGDYCRREAAAWQAYVDEQRDYIAYWQQHIDEVGAKQCIETCLRTAKEISRTVSGYLRLANLATRQPQSSGLEAVHRLRVADVGKKTRRRSVRARGKEGSARAR